MRLLSLAFLLAFVSVSAHAETEELLRFTVTKGDSVTVFRLEKSGAKHNLSMEQGGSAVAERALTPDDLDYLREKLRALGSPRESGCGRSSFRISGSLKGEKENLACGDQLTKEGRAHLELANLLAAFL